MLLLAPFAPYLTEEIWKDLGHPFSVHRVSFPQADASLAQRETVTIAVQVSGKMRGTVTVPHDSDQEAVLEKIAEDGRLQKYTDGLSVKVFVTNTVISFV